MVHVVIKFCREGVTKRGEISSRPGKRVRPASQEMTLLLIWVSIPRGAGAFQAARTAHAETEQGEIELVRELWETHRSQTMGFEGDK